MACKLNCLYLMANTSNASQVRLEPLCQVGLQADKPAYGTERRVFPDVGRQDAPAAVLVPCTWNCHAMSVAILAQLLEIESVLLDERLTDEEEGPPPNASPY